MPVFRVILCVLIAFAFVPNVSAADCPLHQAIYKPHLRADQKNRLNKQGLDFTLTIEKMPPGEHVGGKYRDVAFIFTAYDIKTRQKISLMRLGDACTNGVPVCRISSVVGQFSKNDKDWVNFKSNVDFDVVALDKDMHKIYYKSKIAPEIYIFPYTGPKLYREINAGYDFIERYVRYDTDDKIYPDFGGVDIWKLDSCRN